MVLGRGGTDGIAHLAERQRQNLLAQRLIDRRQPVELHEPDQRPERGSADEQREQHEAGREDRDEALDLGVDRTVLGHAQGERQRDRAAHRAPHDHELIARTDPLGEPEGVEQRQQAEENRGAREQRDDGDDAISRRSYALGADHQPRHQNGRQDEHQRAGPERDLLPDVLQEGPIFRRQPPAPQGVDHEPRHDHGGDARYFEVALTKGVDEVG